MQRLLLGVSVATAVMAVAPAVANEGELTARRSRRISRGDQTARRTARRRFVRVEDVREMNADVVAERNWEVREQKEEDNVTRAWSVSGARNAEGERDAASDGIESRFAHGGDAAVNEVDRDRKKKQRNKAKDRDKDVSSAPKEGDGAVLKLERISRGEAEKRQQQIGGHDRFGLFGIELTGTSSDEGRDWSGAKDTWYSDNEDADIFGRFRKWKRKKGSADSDKAKERDECKNGGIQRKGCGSNDDKLINDQSASRPSSSNDKPNKKDKNKKPKPSCSNNKNKKPKPSGSNDKNKKPKPSGSNDKNKKPKPRGSNDKNKKPKPSGSNDKNKKPKPSGGSNDKPSKPSGSNDENYVIFVLKYI